MTTFTLPSDAHVQLDGNHTPDHNNIIDAIKALGALYNALNTANGGGADVTGGANTVAAINAASAQGVAVLPPGTFLLSGSTALTGPVRGAGAGLTVLKIGASFSGSAAIAVTSSSAEICDLSIIGASSTVTSNPACNGIEITGAQHCKVRDVFFQYVNGWAIESVGGVSTANLDTMIRSITGRNCAGGIHVKGVTGSSFGAEHFLTDIQLQQIGVASGGNANLDCVMVEDAQDVLIENYNGGISDVSTGSTLHIKGTCSSIAIVSPDLGCFPNGSPVGSCILIEDSSNGSPSDCRFTGGVLQENAVGMTVSGAATRISFNGMTFKNNTTHGVVLSGTGSQVNFSDCTWSGNGAGASGTNYDLSVTSSVTGRVFNCHFLTAIVASSSPGVQGSVSLNSSGQDIQFHTTEFRGTGIALSTAFVTNLPSIVRNCKNYNPHGAQVVSVPSSGAATTGLHYDSVFYITAGSSTCTIVKNTSGQGGGTGPSVVIPANGFGSVFVPAQATITPTYSNAPTWLVDGL